MVDIRATRGTSASPEQVLATLQQSDPHRRRQFWSNVTPRYFRLHDAGPGFLDVTEGTFVAGRFWERSRYDWSEPGRVLGTVLDSNVFRPGSTFELRAAPREGGGSRVEVIVRRRFRRGPKGCIAATVNHLGGRRIFGWYLGRVLQAVEQRRARSGRAAPRGAGGAKTEPSPG